MDFWQVVLATNAVLTGINFWMTIGIYKKVVEETQNWEKK